MRATTFLEIESESEEGPASVEVVESLMKTIQENQKAVGLILSSMAPVILCPEEKHSNAVFVVGINDPNTERFQSLREKLERPEFKMASIGVFSGCSYEYNSVALDLETLIQFRDNINMVIQYLQNSVS